tara:strand:+ start:143 stop:1399 length:1257 start_codon:yes stop_codon:yes gene_type:complete
MSFATGFITGLAKSVDDNLKKDMQRTQDRIDGMAQYRITRRRAQLERKDKEKEELRETLENLASLVDGDYDKAAQIYKGAGGTVSSANEFFKVASLSKRTLKDFDISTAFDFATENAPQGMSISKYLDNFTTSVKKLPVSDDEVPTTGLYGALFKPKTGDQIMKQVESTAPLPTETEKFAVPTAKIDYNKFLEAKQYEKTNRFKSGSTNEATLLKLEDELFYETDEENKKALEIRRKDIIARIKKEHEKNLAVKREGKSTTSMFSKPNRDKIINNGIARGVGNTDIIKSIEGELETNIKGNEHTIFAGTLVGMKNLKQEYGANDAILLSKIKSVEDKTKNQIKAYKFDFVNNVEKRGRAYHTVESVTELNAGIKGTVNAKPKILPGDVITYGTGVINPETGQEETKTVIWTGQATGFL